MVQLLLFPALGSLPSLVAGADNLPVMSKPKVLLLVTGTAASALAAVIVLRRKLPPELRAKLDTWADRRRT